MPRVIKYNLMQMVREGVRPGALDREVALLQEGYSKTAKGLNDERSPSSIAPQVFAGKFETLTAKEVEYFGLIRAKKPVVWLLRFRQDLNGKSIIRYDDINYRVSGLPMEDGRKQFIFVPTDALDRDKEVA